MSDRIVPNTLDHDTSGHWEAAQRGAVAVRACLSCATVLHLPRAFCHVCGSWETEWRVVKPTGTLYSFTITEREMRPGLGAPYAVVVVVLDDAPTVRLFGYIAGRPSLEIGMAMRARFEPIDGATLIQWEPDAETKRLR